MEYTFHHLTDNLIEVTWYVTSLSSKVALISQTNSEIDYLRVTACFQRLKATGIDSYNIIHLCLYTHTMWDLVVPTKLCN